MNCTSEYPNLQRYNLGFIPIMKKYKQIIIGHSDHSLE